LDIKDGELEELAEEIPNSFNSSKSEFVNKENLGRKPRVLLQKRKSPPIDDLESALSYVTPGQKRPKGPVFRLLNELHRQRVEQHAWELLAAFY